MAITSDISSIQYVGNDSTVTAYPVPFLFFEAGHLRVIVVDENGAQSVLEHGTDFTVTGEGGTSGQITTTNAWDDTHRLTIYREVPVKQTTSYLEGGAFPAASHERALDLLTMIVQQINRRSQRTLAVSEADAALSTLPATPFTIMGFSGEGQPRTYTAAEMVTFLNLYFPGLSEMYIQSFANSAERAIAIPAYAGQLATQRDEGSLWIASDTTAGAWGLFDTIPESGSITASMLENPLNLSGKTLSLPASVVMPVGSVISFARSTPPTGFLKANGATLSRSTYSELFSVIGTAFGSGDGSTTYRLPDLRGEFIRGWDDGRGVDSGRSFGSWQDHQFQIHTHSYNRYLSLSSGSNGEEDGRWRNLTPGVTGNPESGNRGSETRPRNIALLACIKYTV